MRHLTFLSSALLLTIVVSPSNAAGQSAPCAQPCGQPTAANLPISLDRIRQKLEQQPPALLKGLDTSANFSVQIHERQKIEDLLSTIKIKGGPVPPEGTLAAEIHRLMFRPTDHPLMQPYAEFSETELLTIAIENVVGRYFIDGAIKNLRQAEREHAEKAARKEVQAAMAEFCAANANLGRPRPAECLPPSAGTVAHK